jgi:transcriptional regulator of acetoin/glycerol metabolism
MIPLHHEQTVARPKVGLEMPIRYTGAPIKDDSGNIIGAIEYVLDITQEIKAKEREQALMNAIQTTLEKVDANTDTLSSASEELTSVANQMRDNSKTTSEQANNVASAPPNRSAAMWPMSPPAPRN